jgi:hypothetical protein
MNALWADCVRPTSVHVSLTRTKCIMEVIPMGGRNDGCQFISLRADCSLVLHILLAYVNQATLFITWFSPITVQWTEGLEDWKGIVKWTAGRIQSFSVEMCRGRSTMHGTYLCPQYNERISGIWYCFITRMFCGLVADHLLHLICSLICSDVLGYGMFGLQNIWFVVCMYSSTVLWRKFKRKLSEYQMWLTIFVQ